MEKVVHDLNIDDILPSRFQPRLKFDEDSLNELADSIKEHGVLQPIVVRKIGGKYEIIAGERRYKASVIANKTTIPSIVVDMTDKVSAEMALIENLQRENLSPLEEAISYKKSLDMGYMTQTELAKKMGRSQSFVANKLRLLELTEEVQDALLNNEISERHARSLLRLYDDYEQNKMLDKVIEERLTVRQLDEEITKVIEDNNSLEVLDFLSERKDDSMNREQIPAIDTVSTTVVTPLEKDPTPVINDETIASVTPIAEPQLASIPEEPIKEPTAPIIPIVEEQSVATMPEVPIIPLESSLELSQPIIQQVPSTAVTPPPLNPFAATEEVKPVALDVNQIINEAPVMETKAPIEEKPFENVKTEGVNPGFADINKIETEATEIYKPKEPADLNKILAPTDFKIDHDPEPLPVEETPITTGKFFNFGGDDDAEEVIKAVEPPTFTPKVEPPIQVEPPKPVEIVRNLEDLEEPEKSFDTEGYNNFEYEPDQELMIPTLEAKEPPKEKASLVDAINIIREASSKIEALGFKIDVEEFDFDDMYQSIFKITKN